MKKLALVFVICVLFITIYAGNTLAAEWSQVKVTQVVTRVDSGNVVLQVIPAEGENGFTGTARVTLDATSLGTNKSLALILTAVSMGSTLNIYTDTTPSWTSQPILSVSVYTE